ncbi:TolC family protein [Capnocytophaga sp.]|uniref:TolC family protein n=1 Tax=Capnocytophaga sp. TaxID=44737 RepID=UPI0026DBF4EE|nr:TolC family protein [Capnocytophaga sp.]MDO5104707.1 TolC family protein [Capnocytophaga sp.]
MKCTKRIASLLLALSATAVTAQISVSPSMDTAIRAAKQKSQTLKQKDIEAEKITLERQNALQRYIPRIEASGSYMYLNSQETFDFETVQTPLLGIPLFDGNRTSSFKGNLLMAGVTAKTVLFSGLQIPYGAKALEQKHIGTQQLAKSTADALTQEVITAFDQLKVLDAVQKLIDESQKRLQTEAKRVQKGIEQGLAIPLDMDKIKLAQLELESKQVELNGNKRLIHQKIQYLTGLDQLQISQVTNSFEPFVLLDAGNNLTADEKPEVKALESFAKAQEYVLKKEKYAFLPQVMALGGVRYTSLYNADLNLGALPLSGRNFTLGINEITFAPTWFVGLGAKWELFSGLNRTNKIKQARLDIAATQSKLTDARDKLMLLLQKNIEHYNVANDKLSINAQKVKIAHNNLSLAIKQYEEGLIDISERLQAESDYQKAIIEQAQGIQQQREAAMEVIKVSGNIDNYHIQQ